MNNKKKIYCLTIKWIIESNIYRSELWLDNRKRPINYIECNINHIPFNPGYSFILDTANITIYKNKYDIYIDNDDFIKFIKSLPKNQHPEYWIGFRNNGKSNAILVTKYLKKTSMGAKLNIYEEIFS